jgi:lysophospholipase L1-like esterase
MSYLTSRATASLLALVFALGACVEEDDPNYQNPSFPAITGDAQVVVMSKPPPAAEAGVSAPPAATMDARVPMVMQPVVPDAQVPDAGPPVLIGDAGVAPDGGLGDAAVGDAAVADGGRPPRMDLGKGNGSDVITIGDSWMLLLFTGIQESLTEVSGQPYRKYGVPGTRMLSGEIPGQYTRAKRANPDIKTVVMTGGGNDIIQNAAIERECQTGGPMCTMQLDAIGKSLSELWGQMSKDGVQDVIHVMYSSAAGNPIKDRELNNQKLAESCAAVPPPLRCHLLNTDMIILEADMSSDGIHPSSAGYDKLGKAVFDLMVKEGMRR